MKKISLIALLVLFAFSLSGCAGNKNVTKNGGEEKGNSSDKKEMQKSDNDSGVFDSIKSAIASKAKVECVYKNNEQGGVTEVSSYIEGKKYKTEFAIPGNKKVHTIFDGKTVYTWQDGEKTGTKMSEECMKELQMDSDVNVSDDKKDNSGDDNDVPKAFAGAMNVRCHKVKSIDFSVPKDVNFVDQCEMIKKQKEMISNFNFKQ